MDWVRSWSDFVKEHSLALIGGPQTGARPTTGFQMAMVMLKLCHRVVLYGFGPSAKGEKASSYHFFNVGICCCLGHLPARHTTAAALYLKQRPLRRSQHRRALEPGHGGPRPAKFTIFVRSSSSSSRLPPKVGFLCLGGRRQRPDHVETHVASLLRSPQAKFAFPAGLITICDDESEADCGISDIEARCPV